MAVFFNRFAGQKMHDEFHIIAAPIGVTVTSPPLANACPCVKSAPALRVAIGFRIGIGFGAGAYFIGFHRAIAAIFCFDITGGFLIEIHAAKEK